MEEILKAQKELLEATDIVGECRRHPGEKSNLIVVSLDRAFHLMLSVQRTLDRASGGPRIDPPMYQ